MKRGGGKGKIHASNQIAHAKVLARKEYGTLQELEKMSGVGIKLAFDESGKIGRDQIMRVYRPLYEMPVLNLRPVGSYWKILSKGMIKSDLHLGKK